MEQKAEKILVIDDEPGICRLLQTVLGEAGYLVASFQSPVDGLKALEAGHDHDGHADLGKGGGQQSGGLGADRQRGQDSEDGKQIFGGYQDSESSMKSVPSTGWSL